jgi:acyl-CoA thioester hydrolase
MPIEERPTSATMEIRVRYAECDPMGVLHHSKYLEYFEMGRTQLLRLAGLSYRDMEASGAFLVVAKLTVNYRSSAKYDDVLVLRTTLRRLTRARIEHEYELSHEGRVVCEASTTLACVNRNGHMQAIPDEIYELCGPEIDTLR